MYEICDNTYAETLAIQKEVSISLCSLNMLFLLICLLSNYFATESRFHLLNRNKLETERKVKENVIHIYIWTPQAFLLWLHSVSYFTPHFCEK